MARLAGAIKAAPTPCSPRTAMSTPVLGASDPNSAATANQAAPAAKTRRRPYRSLRVPATSSKPARVIVKAAKTHCSPPIPAPKLRPIAGSAMLVMVRSMATIPEPSTLASSTQRPLVLAKLSAPGSSCAVSA